MPNVYDSQKWLFLFLLKVIVQTRSNTHIIGRLRLHYLNHRVNSKICWICTAHFGRWVSIERDRRSVHKHLWNITASVAFYCSAKTKVVWQQIIGWQHYIDVGLRKIYAVICSSSRYIISCGLLITTEPPLHPQAAAASLMLLMNWWWWWWCYRRMPC